VYSPAHVGLPHSLQVATLQLAMTAEAAASALIELQRQLATAHADIDALQADPDTCTPCAEHSHVHDAQQAFSMSSTSLADDKQSACLHAATGGQGSAEGGRTGIAGGSRTAPARCGGIHRRCMRGERGAAGTAQGTCCIVTAAAVAAFKDRRDATACQAASSLVTLRMPGPNSDADSHGKFAVIAPHGGAGHGSGHAPGHRRAAGSEGSPGGSAVGSSLLQVQLLHRAMAGLV